MAWHYPMIDFLKWINSTIWASWEKYRTVVWAEWAKHRTVVSCCACLLTLAVVVAFAIVHDPKGFSLQNWQTLGSAIVALGAATLAYKAAMKKVRFDEQTFREGVRRKTLAIFMRLDFAVDVLRHEAKSLLQETDPPESSSENYSIAVDDLALSEMPEITEAWENLDYFPVALSEEFYEVQNQLYNFAQFKKDHSGKSFRSEYGMPEREEIASLRRRLKRLRRHCIHTLVLVRREIKKLRQEVI
jgi:hypothetical protein